MSTAAFQSLQVLRTFAQAKAFYEGTAPLRGRDSQDRPLGARRYFDRFRISKLMGGRGEAYACFLYKSPLITYHEDGAIELFFPKGWASLSTAYFFGEVLGIPTFKRKHSIALLTKHETEHAPSQTIVLNPDNPKAIVHPTFVGNTFGWYSASELVNYGWRVNRKQANNVRARYAPFLRMFKALISLRSGTSRAVSAPHVFIPMHEAAHLLPRVTAKQKREATYAGSVPSDVPDDYWLPYPGHVLHLKYPVIGKMDYWAERRQSLLQMMASTEETTLYQAFLLSIVQYGELRKESDGIPTRIPQWFAPGAEVTESEVGYLVRVKHLVASMHDLILEANATEVLEHTELANGKIPDPKYRQWAKNSGLIPKDD